MTQSLFKHVKITGISSVIPPQEICLEDELQYYDNNIKKIERTRKMVGLYKRHVADEDVTASDLSVAAAERLLTEMQVNKDEIDALIFVVQNPDYSSPATACVMHKRLKMPLSCPAFDVNQGCTGYTYGLWLAHSLIEGGQCRKVLLCAGDTSSKNVDLRNRVTAPIFGDAGTATLLEYTDKETPAYFELGTKGEGYKAVIVPAGGARIPFKKDEKENADLIKDLKKGTNTTSLKDIHMDASAVFNFTMTVVPAHLKSLMDFAKKTPEDIEALVLHQANRQIIQMIGKSLNFPLEKVPSSSVEKFGNQTIASIPCTICDTLKESVESKKQKLLLSGFGVGLSWGSCILTIEKIYCSDIYIFEKDKNFKTRSQLIKEWKEKLGE
ncbi:MAG: ketoacyl-ACP synthase III [Alphaproteobacteria bacterium]|nr:ketoacyl-ACP synthase III [Alphaproteobacteria bacterium]